MISMADCEKKRTGAEVNDLGETAPNSITPISRAFLLGLAGLIGTEGAMSFVRDATVGGASLDHAIADLHTRWIRSLSRESPAAIGANVVTPDVESA